MTSRTPSATCVTGLLIAVLIVGALVNTARANEPEKRAMIPFATLGGIKDWRADGDKGMYIQGIVGGKWFYVTFFGFCPDLRFSDRVAFVTEPGPELDKFSSIFVNGTQCSFRTFAASAGPVAAKSAPAATGSGK